MKRNNMKRCRTLLAAAAAALPTLVATAQTVEPIDRLFTDYTTAWIANDGGTQAEHVPHDMLNMFVRDDGTVATVCNWDEGGSNVAVFRDGRLISVPEGSGTGGWGRFSMTSVVMDERYVYQLLSQHGCDGANDRMNDNGLPQFPPCNDAVEWKTIRRYDVETGLAAPFPSGYGYKGDMALVTDRRGRRNWKSEGLIFTATADFDRHDTHRIFSPEKIHHVADLDAGGRLDTLTAYTLDPFLFPDDMRAKPSGVFVTAAFKRRAAGEDLLFISDMYGGALAGYRFDPKEYGYIGIPFLSALNGTDDRPITFWVDDDGDGTKQPEEVRQIREANPYSMSFFVDHACNIWRGTRQQGFMLWRLKGVEDGIPRYADGELYPLPKGTNGAKRIWYDPERDELFIAGFSDAYPDAQDTWWCMGSTIARYSRVMERIDAGTWSADVEPDMTIYMPFNIEDGSGRDHHNAKSFTVEGDYIFVALGRYGYITVYDRRDGHFIGRLQPGPEVGGESGWCDFNYAINAMRQKDGTYRILIEENAFAKILMYTIRDFSSTEVSAPQP